MLSRSLRLTALLLACYALASFFLATSPVEASECSLADHIRSANSNTSVGVCPTGTSHDVITITEDIALSEELPAIRGTITIEGNGHTMSGEYKYRIFNVVGGRLTVNNLTLTKGRAMGEQDKRGIYGGAIRLESGALTVNDSHFINNAARRGGAIAVEVAVRNANPKLTIDNSSFAGNHASFYGGAIMISGSFPNQGGTVSITNSSFSGNVQVSPHQGSGGAIADSSLGRLSVSNSTFSGNQAYQGGALSIRSAKATLTHLSFVDNQADTMNGHAIWIEQDHRLVNLANREINLINSVISGGLPIGVSCYGLLNQNIGNLIEDGSCAPAHNGEAGLGELTGSPGYYAPLDDSFTVDTADPRFCAETDQIGTPRPQGGGCDIGAIESTTARAAILPPPGCGLPHQIIAANTDASAGGCPAGNGADTIRLTGDIVLLEALPPITSDITIEGDGHTISGDRRARIFAVDGGKLTLKDMTLTKGRGAAGGAAWLNNGAELIAHNVNFSGNVAEYGGAIATGSDDVQLRIEQSRFVQNTADESAGAIHIDGGSVAISGSVFRDNRVLVAGRGWNLEGGAIAILKGNLSAFNSSFYNNRAIHGGAFYIGGGSATLTHLTLMNNVSTFSGGDAIQQRGGSAILRNSIVAGAEMGKDCRGIFAELSGNFSEDGSCSPGYRGDPRLGELTGSPSYFPLTDDSPAIDSADQRYCLARDQIGTARPHGGGCDIGAIESTIAIPASPLPLHPKLSTTDCLFADLIIAANTDAPVGDCPAGYLADTIVLTRNITLSAPLQPITSDIRIEGNGYTIDGAERFRIFDVDGGQLQLSQLTLRNGSAPVETGGAIRLRNGAVLNGSEVEFVGNSAENGAAIAAIDSLVNIDNSQFVGNHAAYRGAGLYMVQGRHFSLNFVTGWGNTAPGARDFPAGTLASNIVIDSDGSLGYVYDHSFR